MKVSRQLMIYLAEHLANGYYSDRYTSITTSMPDDIWELNNVIFRRIASLLNRTEVFLLPSLNPDGYAASRFGLQGNWSSNCIKFAKTKTAIFFDDIPQGGSMWQQQSRAEQCQQCRPQQKLPEAIWWTCLASQGKWSEHLSRWSPKNNFTFPR